MLSNILQPFFRLINKILIRLLYRVKVVGLEHVPASGGALLVANHIAYSDPPLLTALIPRPIRFLMFRGIYELPVVNTVSRVMQAIPISERDGPKELLRSLMKARECLERGEIVCVFAEGALTRIGTMLPFNRGFERIVKGLTIPIIPVHLDRLWGSVLSHRGKAPFTKFPRRLPYPVTVTFGAPLPSATAGPKVRAVIQEMAADAFHMREATGEDLASTFLRTAKKNIWRPAIADSSGTSLRYGSLLASSCALARQLQVAFSDVSAVPILLPPSTAAVVANVAALLAGKTAVNLNYTLSPEALAMAAAQCRKLEGWRTPQDQPVPILTSRIFLTKLKMEAQPGAIFIEDLVHAIPRFARVRAAIESYLVPSFVVRRLFPSPPRLATVIFSSGSTGTPKGVMLSHRNILSNIEGLSDVFQLVNQDCIVGVLPFFHSFGFTGTLWLPILNGIRAVYHPNPLDAGTIGQLAKSHRATLLLATPTFLAAYQRKCSEEEFATLRRVVVGAEKLKDSFAKSFFDKYKIQPLEGYGCTELSPVATLSLPSVNGVGVRQTGNKPGSVGHPLPGVAVRVVDPESFESRGEEAEGLLLVKGPNVMSGYLGESEKTKEVIRAGWYVTGDIARLDADGFVYITDRLSRFSKIAGEMVPHIKVEEEIQRVIGGETQTIVVSALPHEKKGEQLVVLHTIPLDPSAILEQLKGLPNLWLPRRENFFQIEQIPLLGTGKLDLQKIKKIAELKQKESNRG